MGAIAPGKAAPRFELTGLDGKKYAVSSMAPQEVAVVSFFKATCPTCQFALPFLDKLFQHHREDSSIRFFSVAQEDREGAKGFAESYRLTMPVALDSKPYNVSGQYGLTTVPTVFLIGGDGTVQQTTVGFVKKEYEELAQKLARVTAKKAAPLFEGASVPDIKPG